MANCPEFERFMGSAGREQGSCRRVGTDLGCWGDIGKCWVREYKARQAMDRRNVLQNIRRERQRAQTLEAKELGEPAVILPMVAK